MTDIEQKALALVNAIEAERGLFPRTDSINREHTRVEAICRAIERHEAFRQEVSDAVEAYAKLRGSELGFNKRLQRFIIAKPNPLAECLLELDLSEDEQEARHDAEWLVKTIEKRGGKLTWGEG